MSRQGKKNRNYLVILIVLSLISISLNLFTGNSDNNLDIDRDAFQMKNTLEINRIVARGPKAETTLSFEGGKWMLNSSFQADPSRVHLLFAAVQQVSVRRPVSSKQQATVDSLFEAEGFAISFFEGDKLVREIETAGDELNGVTYFRQADKTFIVEIPGYRTFIHGLIAIDHRSWRNMNLLHRINWRNLGGIQVTFPFNTSNNFSISRKDGLFAVNGIAESDTTKVFDYIDYVSLLHAVEYPDIDPDLGNKVIARIDVRDVGNRSYLLELLDQQTESGMRLGRMDSSYYFTIEEFRIEPLFVGPADFAK